MVKSYFTTGNTDDYAKFIKNTHDITQKIVLIYHDSYDTQNLKKKKINSW